MMKARHAFAVLLPVIVLPLSVWCSAQVVDISDCRAVEDRLQRFDCYENLGTPDTTASQQEETAPASLPVQQRLSDSVPAVVRPEAREQPAPVASQRGEDLAVDTVDARSETANARAVDSEDGKTELVDTVVALEQRLPNLWLITLKSGQQWMQMLGKSYPMREGDEVRIYPTRWGSSYRLSATRLSGHIQVERVD